MVNMLVCYLNLTAVYFCTTFLFRRKLLIKDFARDDSDTSITCLIVVKSETLDVTSEIDED